MSIDDKMYNLIRDASPEQLRVMVAWLWGGLQHVRPTNQSEREWYEALCKTVGVQP